MKQYYFLVAAALLGTSAFAQIKDLPVTAINTQLCAPDAGHVNINDAEIGVDYTLRNSSNTVVGTTLSGTGPGNMIGWTLPITASETYNVLAEAKHSVGLALDGNNDFIDADSLDFDYHLAYTYEAWVKTPGPSTGYYQPVFYVGTPGISDIEIYVRPNDLMVLYERGKPGLQEHRFPSPPDDTWFHLAVTYNGSTTKVYYDGVEQTVVSGTPNGTLTQTNGAEVNIGVAPNITVTQSHQRYFDGQIDDIRIWSTVRTLQEIQGSASTCLNGNEAGLENFYRIDGTPGTTTVTDMTGGNDGTLTNANAQDAWVIVDNAGAPCMSNATLQLSNTAAFTLTSINVSVTNNGNSLTANQSGATYQWMDCMSFAPVSGANNQTFAPAASGMYAVILTMGGCEDTSACESVVIIGAPEPTSAIALSPNPSQGRVHFTASAPGATLTVWNALGQQVGAFTAMGSELEFDLPQAPGVYMVEIHLDGRTETRRLLRL